MGGSQRDYVRTETEVRDWIDELQRSRRDPCAEIVGGGQKLEKTRERGSS